MIRWIWGSSLAPKVHLFSGFAAAIAFYLMLSLAPLLAVAIGLSVRFLPPDVTHNMARLVKEFIPPDTLLDVDAMVQTAEQLSGDGFLTLTFAFALWSASGFTMQIVNALRLIFASPVAGEPRGWVNRLLAFLLLVLWSFPLLAAALLMLTGPAIETRLAQTGQISGLALYLWPATRHGLAFLTLLAIFYLTYRVTSSNHYRKRLLFRAALMTTAGWVALGFLYSRVLSGIWSASVLYGTLGGFIATLMWAYLSAWVVLLGACYVVRSK